MAMNIGMTKPSKLYVLSYLVEPAKFYNHMPTIQLMIDSFGLEGQNGNDSKNELPNSELA